MKDGLVIVPGLDARIAVDASGTVYSCVPRYGRRPSGTWRVLPLLTDRDGYVYVYVRGGQKAKVHQLVYLAFHGPIPPGSEIDHGDHDKQNNRPTNLEAVTHVENMRRAWRTGRMNVPESLNKQKTHCPSGHPYDEQNTYVAPNGWRQCRICRRQHDLKRRTA